MNGPSVGALLQAVIVLISVLQPNIPQEQIQRSHLLAASLQSAGESRGSSPDHRSLLEWAEDRFSRAGLEFPEVDIRFHPDISACDGHVGLFNGGDQSIQLCRTEKKAILHELAHAWAHANLTDRQRSEFTALRGLDAWNDHDLEWSERATEHAAEIITWALMDRNTLVPWVTKGNGTEERTWRLLTIDDSHPDQLQIAYEFLTGKSPVDRLEDDPRLLK